MRWTVGWLALVVACGGESAVGSPAPEGSTGAPSIPVGSASTGAPMTTGITDTEADGSGEASSSTSDASGGPECGDDGDCDDGNPCTLEGCDVDAGACIRDPLDGVDAPEDLQTDGDCLRVTCSDGEATDVVDDGDAPDDRNDCTADSCSEGTPVHDPASPGTPCGVDGECNDAGACVECISPADCDMLPPDDDCQTRTCEDGVCGQAFSAAGTPVNATLQTEGDCQLVVCDGAGDIEPEDDDADVPVDGFECTQDVCAAGVPSNPPEMVGMTCGDDSVCDGAGDCVGCVDASDCTGTETFCRTLTCDDGVCGVASTPAGTPLPGTVQTEGDCQELQCDGDGDAESVPDDGDVPEDDGNDCTDEICIAGVEQHPDEPLNTMCSDNGGAVCDGAGTCVDCNLDTHCAGANQCQRDVCDANVCTTPSLPMGTGCNDFLFCTAVDQCNGAGACIGTGDPCPGEDGDANCRESCNEGSGDCSAFDASGAACDDGLFCTDGDTCDGSGGCDPGPSDPCPGPDGDGNCAETCDEGADNCLGNDAGGTGCDDGFFCTSSDSCNGGGSCVGSGDPCPGPNDGDADCFETCDDVANNCDAYDGDLELCTAGVLGGVCVLGSCVFI